MVLLEQSLLSYFFICIIFVTIKSCYVAPFEYVCQLQKNATFHDEWPDHFVKTKAELLEKGYFGESIEPNKSQFIVVTKGHLHNIFTYQICTNAYYKTEVKGRTNVIPTPMFVSKAKMLHEAIQYLKMESHFSIDTTKNIQKMNMRRIYNASFYRSQNRVVHLLKESPQSLKYDGSPTLITDFVPQAYHINQLYAPEFTLYYYLCSVSGDDVKENELYYQNKNEIQMTDPKLFDHLFKSRLKPDEVQCTLYSVVEDQVESITNEVQQIDPNNLDKKFNGISQIPVSAQLISHHTCPNKMIPFNLKHHKSVQIIHDFDRKIKKKIEEEEIPPSTAKPTPNCGSMTCDGINRITILLITIGYYFSSF